MSNSYQHEIPSARVNITLDVETGGHKSKKELPMKLLMIGDFSHGQATGAIADRERLNINKQNFNQILSTIKPKINLSVPDCTHSTENDLSISLEFNEYKDFKPEQIVEQVPALKRLKAMRNLLKDLKSSVIDNQGFRKHLETILADVHGQSALKQELTKNAPLDI